MVNKLRLNFETSECQTLSNKFYISVVVIKGKKDRILYNSGRNYFYHKEAQEAFIKAIEEKVPSNYKLEIHDVSMVVPIPPDPSIPKITGTYWCPFCGGYHKFSSGSDGYARCPICNISNSDAHVKNYNNLWPSTKLGKK